MALPDPNLIFFAVVRNFSCFPSRRSNIFSAKSFSTFLTVICSIPAGKRACISLDNDAIMTNYITASALVVISAVIVEPAVPVSSHSIHFLYIIRSTATYQTSVFDMLSSMSVFDIILSHCFDHSACASFLASLALAIAWIMYSSRAFCCVLSRRLSLAYDVALIFCPSAGSFLPVFWLRFIMGKYFRSDKFMHRSCSNRYVALSSSLYTINCSVICSNFCTVCYTAYSP